MKKFSILLTLLVLVLAACSSSSTGMPVNSTSNDMPIETQLAAGILKLAGTDQDVSVEQATELLLYWQVYQDLSESDTAAQAEVDGLIAQIQETMTADQMQTITAMQLTQQDVFTLMQGVTVVSSSSESDTINVPAGGSMPAGGPPSDGGGAPMDGGMPADMGGAVPASAADQSQSGQAGSGLENLTRVPSALVEAVIQSLQQKTSA